jgi:hypothetical protein
MSERTLIMFVSLALAFVTVFQAMSNREQGARVDILSDRVEAQRLQIMDLESGR